MSAPNAAMERTDNGSTGGEVVSGDVLAVLSAAVADFTAGNDPNRGDTASVPSSDGGGGGSPDGPSHSQAMAADSEARRQRVVDLARARVASSASGVPVGDSPVPTTATCMEGGEDDQDSSAGNDVGAQEHREVPAALSPLSKAQVERSIEEVKAKMMMAQEDSDDDEEEGNYAKDESEKDRPEKASSTKLLSKNNPTPGLTIDAPFDEPPRDLPHDVPSFDAGEGWEGSTRRPASPPIPLSLPRPLPSAPPAAPTNATSKGKHFFGRWKDKKKTGAVLTPPSPPSPDNGAPEVPNAQSTSYEDSDADADGGTPLPFQLPTSTEDVIDDVMSSVARARAVGSSGSSSINSRRHVGSSSNSRSFRKKSRTGVSKEDRDERQDRQQRGRLHTAHSASRSDRKSRTHRSKPRPESTMSDGDQTMSTSSFAQTTSKHGISGSKGILEACDPIGQSTSQKSSLILEFEDQDLIGWIMNGEACTTLHKCSPKSIHSHRVEQVTSDDDDVSDISNLTGRWRRSRLLMKEQQKRKAEDEANKRHSNNPFNVMSIVCGDLKALLCDGLKPDAASF